MDMACLVNRYASAEVINAVGRTDEGCLPQNRGRLCLKNLQGGRDVESEFMTVADWCYSGLIAFWLIIDHFIAWPAFLRRSQIDAPSARLSLWRTWMSLLWTLTVLGIAIWLWDKRAWEALGLSVPEGWRLWGSAILLVGFAALQALTVAKIARIAGPKPKLRAQLGKLAMMLPHSQSELRWFIGASLTAGICEEFLFRGYLIWAFTPALGWRGAAALSLLAFTAGHAYQGRSGALRSAGAGIFFSLLVLATGSLIPAMVLHALIDAGSGVIAWLVLRDESANDEIVSAVKSP
jgi:membrane protease YdiL (CAAX protease family)